LIATHRPKYWLGGSINIGKPSHYSFFDAQSFYDEKNYFSSASEHLDEKPIYQKLSEQIIHLALYYINIHTVG